MGWLRDQRLEIFGRALRLRWLWYSWEICDRPWKELLKHHDKTDRALDFAYNVIIVGDGRNTPFWEARWRVSPKELAPNLYKHTIYRKWTTSGE
jgi:hypothetical protein